MKEAAEHPPAHVLAGASRTAADQNIQEQPKTFSEKLKSVCEYICHTVYPNLMLTSQEQLTMLRGFEGEYIEPGPSGAPSSGGAYLLPTGRNFYGVDPRTLPTAAAWEIGKSLNIIKVHPHKFRRTLATMAIDKGMPIEQLQRLLGHQRIDTTLMYAMIKQSNVKIAHKKFLG